MSRSVVLQNPDLRLQVTRVLDTILCFCQLINSCFELFIVMMYHYD